jgi:hypothetical protein
LARRYHDVAMQAVRIEVQTHFDIKGADEIARALIACAIWWAMRAMTASAGMPALTEPPKMQLAMLVEAAMLGYALARKGNRVS